MAFRGWLARFGVLGGALCAAACMPQIESSEPLLEAGSQALRPGLWALLAADCEAPADAQMFDWPSCAIPVRVRPGDLALLIPALRRAPYRLADGTPLVLQVRITEEELIGPGGPDSSAYTYYSFAPAGGAPLVAGEVRMLRCPPDDEMPIEGLALEGEGVDPAMEPEREAEAEDRRCVAATAMAVREAARRSLIKRPDWRAVWVAELP